MMGRLLCWLGVHRPPPGINAKWSICWYCVRCYQVVPGDLSRGRR